MTQSEKAQQFAALHVKGKPLVLYNIWDAGSAKAVAEAGAKAVATGSWSVAAAQGYGDGQALPLELLETIVGRITASVDLPLSVDFEGAYAAEPEGVAGNVARIIAAGAIGINFEDQVVGGEGLYPIETQAARVATARKAGEEAGVPLFVNARTDLFLKEKDAARHGDLVAEALERAAAYQEAGASGFFVPGLSDLALLQQVCDGTALPVNGMKIAASPSVAELAAQGVARISHGPAPYWQAMKDLGGHADAIYGGGA